MFVKHFDQLLLFNFLIGALSNSLRHTGGFCLRFSLILLITEMMLIPVSPSYREGEMIKLFKVKEKQRELAENANGKSPIKKQSAGELRLHKGCSTYASSSLSFNC